MVQPPVTPRWSTAAVVVRCEPPGIVLVVRGGLDAATCELLREVVNAALVAVGYANRIRLDLSRVTPAPDRLPRLVRRLERAGAAITRPSSHIHERQVGVAPYHPAFGGFA